MTEISSSLDFVRRMQRAAISELPIVLQVYGQHIQNEIALLFMRSGKIWPVDITTIFPLMQSIGHMPTAKAAN